ncbi:MAG: hypothetical protein GY730_10160, partial [bacterium]|nr:hypothetical protein [bacterium]
DINRIIDETYYSLERLFSKISLDDKKMNEIEGYYHACIILFSDSQFSRLIVTRNPKFLYHFFRFIIQKNEKEAEKNKCLLKKLQPIVSCLLTQSILNSDSILRKENDYQEALSYFDDFTSLIFKNYALLNSSLNLFDFNIKTTHCYTSDEVSMICRWYETAFDFYINNDVKKGVPRNLIVGFHYLNEIVRHCVNQRGINKGDALELFSCCTAVGDVYEKALSYLSNNPPTTFNEKYSDFNNTTCVEYIGMKVYKYIETLSIDKDVWLFHLGTCSLWEYLKILDDDANKPLINTLKKKFQDELKKTITRNLNTQQPRYPLVIKGLIFECNLYPATENTIFKLVNDELKKRFYALYSFSKEKALELLPEDAKYDENTHELIYYNRVSYTEYRLEININGD